MDSLVGLIMAFGFVSAIVAVLALWTQRDADREREREFNKKPGNNQSR
jgi:hypothetical protein